MLRSSKLTSSEDMESLDAEDIGKMEYYDCHSLYVLIQSDNAALCIMTLSVFPIEV